jgi:hypothetical protein
MILLNFLAMRLAPVFSPGERLSLARCLTHHDSNAVMMLL